MCSAAGCFQQVDGGLGTRELAALRLFLVAPLLALALPAVDAPWPTSGGFLTILAIGVPLEIVALLLYAQALKAGPIASGLPILALTPALLLLTGPLIAGDPLVFDAAPGILVLIAGVWFLNADRQDRAAGTDGRQAAAAAPAWPRRLLDPFAAVLRDPAARAMLGVALIYSVTAALGKRGAQMIGPAPMTVYYFLPVAILCWIIVTGRIGRMLRLCRAHPWLTAGIALTYGAHQFTHIAGVVLIPVAELIALKRLSLLMAPLAAVLILREHLSRWRLAGIVLMVVGAIWIGLIGGMRPAAAPPEAIPPPSPQSHAH
jgi:drug/metabolite transporter (DMT)-like permease